jgi:uncharacterized protein YkwD
VCQAQTEHRQSGDTNEISSANFHHVPVCDTVASHTRPTKTNNAAYFVTDFATFFGRYRRSWNLRTESTAMRMVCTSLLFLLGAASCVSLAQAAPAKAGAHQAPAGVSSGSATQILSEYRKQNGLAPVVYDPLLQKVAETQAVAMARADVLSHDIAGGLSSRMAASGAPCRACAENVAAGYGSVGQVFAGWKVSSGHNANLLNPSMRRIGIAMTSAPNSRFKNYWALVLAD